MVVTPYLVKPISTQLAVPTDGYRAPDDIQRDFGGQTFTGVSGARAPTAISASPQAGAVTPAAAAAAPGFKL